MVLFSDGEDSSVIASGTPVADIVSDAVRAEVPIYFVRTRYGREFGTLVSDGEWRAAVEQTGGRFYAASDETAILQAIRDIDRLGAGRIEFDAVREPAADVRTVRVDCGRALVAGHRARHERAGLQEVPVKTIVNHARDKRDAQ